MRTTELINSHLRDIPTIKTLWKPKCLILCLTNNFHIKSTVSYTTVVLQQLSYKFLMGNIVHKQTRNLSWQIPSVDQLLQYWNLYFDETQKKHKVVKLTFQWTKYPNKFPSYRQPKRKTEKQKLPNQLLRWTYFNKKYYITWILSNVNSFLFTQNVWMCHLYSSKCKKEFLFKQAYGSTYTCKSNPKKKKEKKVYNNTAHGNSHCSHNNRSKQCLLFLFYFFLFSYQFLLHLCECLTSFSDS